MGVALTAWANELPILPGLTIDEGEIPGLLNHRQAALDAATLANSCEPGQLPSSP